LTPDLDDEDPITTTIPGHSRRNHSISSAFDFAPGGYTSLGATFDPSTTHAGQSLERNKSLTYLNGLSLVIGLIIGSGIFSAPSQVNVNAGSPGASLIVWTVAGLLAWTGASSYAELGNAIPLNGGAQQYLTHTFGELAGFLYSWCAVCVLKPGSAAIIAIIMGEYVIRAFTGAEGEEVSLLVSKGVAIAGLILVTLLNSVSTKLADRSADLFLFFKFIALLAVAVIGIFVAITGFSWQGQADQDWKTRGWFEGTNADFSHLAVALYAALWAFDGWDNVNFVTGELLNPTRDLPLIVHTTFPLVITAYLLANTAYFLVLPLSINFTSETIAVAFGAQVFGGLGALVFALTVSGSCFGALNATTFTSSRLFFAAAKEGYLPSIIGTLGLGSLGGRADGLRLPSLRASASRAQIFNTPIPSLLLNLTLTSVYIVIGTFSSLVLFYGVASQLFYFLTVLGLLVLRVKEPQLERPYKCWITTPIGFCCVSLFLLSRSVVAQPMSSLGVVGYLVAGTGVWWVKIRKVEGQGRGEDGQAWRVWRRWTNR